VDLAAMVDLVGCEVEDDVLGALDLDVIAPL
jgi:hypothetical protein